MIFQIVEKIRPFLLKIFPQAFLKKIKNKIVEDKEKRMLLSEIPAFDANYYLKGVNVIGPLKSQNGLGQSCRLIAEIIKETGLGYALYDYCMTKNIARNDHTFDEELTQKLSYGINLIHLNPFELRMAYLDLGKELPAHRYNIGYWLYELEDIPADWLPALELVDEIWTPSEYISGNFRKITDKPVYTQSYCVTAPVMEQCGRKYFSLPEDQFLYLVMYDSKSTQARKNPMGAIKAYKQAFPQENKDAGLIIKINNAGGEDMDLLKKELADYQNVFFITDTLPKTEVNSLIKAADVFISLHRAEGYGLVMAEAMINGTVCVATNYSSNTEFMNDDVACMIGYDLVPLEGDTGFYLKNSKWAEPHLDEAAAGIRRLYEDPDYYSGLQTRARTYINKKMDRETIVSCMRNRLEQIYQNADK